MTDWFIIIHISKNVTDDIIFRYDATSNMTVHALYIELFKYMSINRPDIISNLNLRFNNSHGIPINWELTNQYDTPLNLDDYIWPNHDDIMHNIVLNLYKITNQNNDAPPTLPPIAANVMTFPSKTTPAPAVAGPATDSRRWNLSSVPKRIKQKEYVSPEELRACRDLYNSLAQEQDQIWKEQYIQKLIKGNTGIGILGNYDDFMATVYDILGFEVTDLTDLGTAKSAGILVGDRILYVNGNSCMNSWEYKYHIIGEPSSQIKLDLEREGERMTLTFNRNPSRDNYENSELIKFAKSSLSTSSGGNKKRLSKKGIIYRKRLSKKTICQKFN